MAPAGRALAFATAIAVAVAGGGPSLVPAPARAQEQAARGLPIIRDTEIENLLRDYAAPILKAAGLAKQNVRIVILNDRTFNAFVMDGRHIFINAGALFDAKTPNEIIGVFAHETGHLAGGHLLRLREELARAQTASIVALLAGVGAAVAGARAGSGNIGVPAIMAPQSAIQRSLLAYVRTQEDQADHAGVKFLTATGQSAKGMLDLFKRLGNEALFNSRYVDPYLQSHPMPPERVAALEALAKASPYFERKDSPELQLRHDMMRAKLAGFLDRPDSVARRYPLSDHSLPARYARAISTYRHGDARDAVVQIDGLIQTQPNNPYFYELKGQTLMDGGHPARSGRAAAPRGRARAWRPADRNHARPGADRHQRDPQRRRSRAAAARRAVARAGGAGRLRSARHGLWPQRRSRPGRSRRRASRLQPRRHRDRASTRVSRQDPFARGLARLGARRRYCQRQTTDRRQKMITARTKPMTSSPRYIAAACAALLAIAAPQAVRAQNFSPAQRSDIERVVHDYLIAHPEVIQEAMGELEKRQTAAEAEKHKVAVKEHAQKLYSSPNQVTLGNPNGNVTFVEFFDYNCGYCKRAMDDMLTLLKDDPKLKVVLKEFPVLGPGSLEAARVAVAVRMQDKTGKKYLEFHTKLLGGRGPADQAHALAVAKDIGMNMPQIEKDMKGPEVKATLDEDFKLAEALGLNGTPSYVIGSEVVVGAIGLPGLQEKVNTARCGKPTC